MPGSSSVGGLARTASCSEMLVVSAEPSSMFSMSPTQLATHCVRSGWPTKSPAPASQNHLATEFPPGLEPSGHGLVTHSPNRPAHCQPRVSVLLQPSQPSDWLDLDQ